MGIINRRNKRYLQIVTTRVKLAEMARDFMRFTDDERRAMEHAIEMMEEVASVV